MPDEATFQDAFNAIVSLEKGFKEETTEEIQIEEVFKQQLIGECGPFDYGNELLDQETDSEED